jgi:ATP-binding cassette subfamily B protein
MDWLRLLGHVIRLTRRVGRRPAGALCVLVVAQAGIIAGVGLSQRLLVDASMGHHLAGLVVAVVLGALAFAVSSTAGRVRGNLQIYLVGRVRAVLNEEIQETVSAIPTITHVEYAPYIDRWNRIFQSSQALASMPWTTLDCAVAFLGLAVTVALLASVSPLLCLLALLGVPLVLANRHADRLLRAARDAGTEFRRREQRLHELSVDPESAKEVMLTAGEASLNRDATGFWNAATSREVAARLRGAAWQGTAWVLYAAGFTAALLVVADLIRGGRATVGAAVLVVSLATQLQGQLRTVLDGLVSAAEAGQVVSHYWWLRRYLESGRRGGGTVAARLVEGITLRGVNFRYPGAEHDVLHDITVHLPAGSTVAIVGPNGAGKSTLIKLVTGLYEPTSGQVLVDGAPLPDLDSTAWRARLTGIHQDFARLRLRLRETVGIGELRHIRNRPAVRRAIEHAEAPLLNGLDGQLGAPFGGVEPSLGQWQRLALARSLMPEVTGERPPVCLVLDEPTAALDPLAEHELFTRFLDQVRRATRDGAVTVLVSHRLTTVRMADLIVVVEDGRIVEQGSHRQLMAADGGYAELYRLQQRAYR